MNRKAVVIPLTILGIIIFVILLHEIGNRRQNALLENVLAEREVESQNNASGCILHDAFDVRWPLLAEFGFTHTISRAVDTCGLMRLRSIFDENENLTRENLAEFVSLVVDFTKHPSYQGGFTAEDIYPILEKLDLFDYYLFLLENYD